MDEMDRFEMAPMVETFVKPAHGQDDIAALVMQVCTERGRQRASKEIDMTDEFETQDVKASEMRLEMLGYKTYRRNAAEISYRERLV